jgi:hypothetical protein
MFQPIKNTPILNLIQYLPQQYKHLVLIALDQQRHL